MGNIKKVLLVVNPISGDIDKSSLIEHITKAVIEIGGSLSVFETSGENDQKELEKIIDKTRPCRIICAGGDGTIKLVSQALLSHHIPIGIIPAGSANGLAYNLLLPETLPEQIDVALGNSLQTMDIINIDDELCLHISDFGLNAELIKNYEDSNVRGKWGYLLQSITTLVESEYPFQFLIEANKKVIETEGILVAIANARSFGTGATVNPNGKINDGKFEILIFKNFDIIEILKTLRNEVDLNPDFVRIISTREAVITCTKPVAFQIDGEYLGEKNSVHATIHNKKLQVAAPSNSTVFIQS
ncbi:diacylglycerol kinase [soil metagenome]